MKKIFTLLFALAAAFFSFAQTCTTSGFDMCDPSTAISSDFRNGVQIAGTGNPLSVGAKYKFNNVIPGLSLDAVISIDAIVNATLKGAGNPTIDDDGVTGETGSAAELASLFAPRIAPDQPLTCSNRTGYVEFTLKFYTHYAGNGAPGAGTEIGVANLTILNFDMDGITVGTNGWLKETGAVKTNNADPVIFAASTTELTNDPNSASWVLTYGSTVNRNGIAKCTEVIEKSVYTNSLSAFSFRLGYDYKAPTSDCAGAGIQPTRDYGVRFGCFNLPAAGPLPVSLVKFGATYSAEKANIVWTSLQESNMNSYEIQRSFDGTNFEVAGYVKSNNLTTVQLYTFTDDVSAFNSKYIYYRIRIVDNDHSMKLTNTVLLKVDEPKANEMLISPTPATTNAQIKVKAMKAGMGDLMVFDAAGKVVLHQQAALLTGNNTIPINNINALSSGYYTIRLIVNDETFTSKLLIWK